MRLSYSWFLHPGRRMLLGLLGLATAAVIGGCATAPVPSAPSDTPVALGPGPAMETVPVIRYGRYTLVELAPVAAQQNLLLQVVDVSVPDTLYATVADALRHVLRRSGYQLCAGQDTDALGSLPLPAAHYELGPVMLRDALLTLAGPTWDLHVDDGIRQVCFRHTGQAPVAPQEAPSVTDADVDSQPQTGQVSMEVEP